MEPDQTERAETVVNADRSGRQVVVSGRERMEMRDADRLRPVAVSTDFTESVRV